MVQGATYKEQEEDTESGSFMWTAVRYEGDSALPASRAFGNLISEWR